MRIHSVPPIFPICCDLNLIHRDNEFLSSFILCKWCLYLYGFIYGKLTSDSLLVLGEPTSICAKMKGNQYNQFQRGPKEYFTYSLEIRSTPHKFGTNLLIRNLLISFELIVNLDFDSTKF
jgi:hypothetical protein